MMESRTDGDPAVAADSHSQETAGGRFPVGDEITGGKAALRRVGDKVMSVWQRFCEVRPAAATPDGVVPAGPLPATADSQPEVSASERAADRTNNAILDAVSGGGSTASPVADEANYVSRRQFEYRLNRLETQLAEIVRSLESLRVPPSLPLQDFMEGFVVRIERDVQAAEVRCKEWVARQWTAEFAKMREALLPPEKNPAEVAFDSLEHSLLGPELAACASLESSRARLFRGVQQGQDSAGSLVGWWLAFRTTAGSERHKILRPLGEALYRWLGENEADELMAETWVAATNKLCQDFGLRASVERIRLGVRFDPDRHLATGRPGRDVTEVWGWVVVLPDGRVFDKALVTVQ